MGSVEERGIDIERVGKKEEKIKEGRTHGRKKGRKEGRKGCRARREGGQ